uniref:Transforming growth factor, alpha n=3 Tax=Nothobranchius TaxID=28779 RepID=A0A1A8HLH2_NOTKU
MMWILWDALVLLGGSLFTFGTGPSSSAMIEGNVSITTNATAAPNTSTSSSLTPGKSVFPINVPTDQTGFFVPTEAEQISSTVAEALFPANTMSVDDLRDSINSNSTSTTKRPAGTNNHPVKKFVAAAVRSHFDDCPDSHQHFCFHGTCRFLVQEETPACVCHPGFVGLRCEHADLLAIVATNHRQQAVATVLVLCVIGCVLIMVLCSFLHCWWRQDCRRRSRAHLYVTEKHGVPCYPPESVV